MMYPPMAGIKRDINILRRLDERKAIGQGWSCGDSGGDYNDVVMTVKGLIDTEDTADGPEPATGLAMLGIGLVGWRRLRRRPTHHG